MKKVFLSFIVMMTLSICSYSANENSVSASVTTVAVDELLQPELLLESMASESTAVARFRPDSLEADEALIPFWLGVALKLIRAMIDCCVDGDCCSGISNGGGGTLPPNNGTIGGKLSVDVASYNLKELQAAGASYDKTSGKLVLSREIQLDQNTFAKKLFVQAGTYYIKNGETINATFSVR